MKQSIQTFVFKVLCIKGGCLTGPALGIVKLGSSLGPLNGTLDLFVRPRMLEYHYFFLLVKYLDTDTGLFIIHFAFFRSSFFCFLFGATLFTSPRASLFASPGASS